MMVRERHVIGVGDVLAFADVSSDRARHHVDEEYARATFGRQVVHGALLVAYMSAASTVMAARTDIQVVAVGFDRIRFIKPVFVGDTVWVSYEVTAIEPVKRRITANVNVTNQDRVLVAVAIHLMQPWIAS